MLKYLRYINNLFQGDGIKLLNEDCDDGNFLNHDGCSSICKVEYGYQCNEIQNKSYCALSSILNCIKIIPGSSLITVF